MGFLDIFDSGEKKRRMNHVKNLLVLAAQDGEITQDELEFILQIAVRSGISPSEFNRILERPGSISFYPPNTYAERIDQLIDMVGVMMIDGEIHEREVNFCKTIAIKLGFNHRIIEKLVLEVIDSLAHNMARDAIIAHLLRLAQ